jgi:chaperonin cofactor prefoldin
MKNLSYKEKAEQYDHLKREVDRFISNLEEYWQQVESIKDIDPELEKSDYSSFKTKQLGTYQGINLALKMKINMFKRKLGWYN